MCLIADRKATDELRKKMGDKPRRFWKRYRVRSDVHGRQWLSAIAQGVTVHPGVVKSNRRKQTWRSRKICRGIHVYCSREFAAKEALDRGGVVVPVTAVAADLVASDGDSERWAEAVFMKVTLTKRAYNKAIRAGAKAG